MRRTLVVGVALLGLSCARQGRIPGGPPDRVPPIVVAVEPEPETIVHDWDGPIRIEFNERISERGAEGSLDDAILVSPAVEGLRVSHSRSGLEVSVPGGFEVGRVYRVTVLPVISDLFSNRMRDPFEFAFSTGPEISGAIAAGLVEDRITGQPVQVRVEAVGPDSIVHFTRSGTDGLFALRYLPPARYRLRAYEDRNRNGEADFSEPVGGLPITLPSDADTSLTSFTILLPDTTSARLIRAEVLDSVSVRVEFDDYIDPAENLALVGVGLKPDTAIADSLLPESTLPLPGFDRVMHEHAFQEYQAEVRLLEAARRAEEARVRAAAALAAGDSTATPPSPPDPGPEIQPEADPEEDAGPPRPVQTLIAVFETPLQARYPYRVQVTGLRNINRLPLGGGTIALVWNPPDVDSIPSDSTTVDTTGVIDTLVIDTLVVDTLVIDTAVADTMTAIDTSAVVDTTARIDTSFIVHRGAAMEPADRPLIPGRPR